MLKRLDISIIKEKKKEKNIEINDEFNIREMIVLSLNRIMQDTIFITRTKV